MSQSRPILFIDLGSSLLKIFLHHQDQLRTYLLSPTLAPLTPQRLQTLRDANPNAEPEDLCWVEQDHQLIALGPLADSLSLTPNLKQRKMEPGLIRVLGVLGLVQTWLDLPPNFECDLGIALPVAEYADREPFSNHLRQAADSFVCRDQKLSVQFRLLDIQIEGMGLVRDRRAELIKAGQSPRNLKIVALMFGHRNLSVLTFSGSTLQLETSTSSGPGFSKAIAAFARNLAVEPTHPDLVALVAERRTSYRFEGSLKPRDITQAVRDAIAQYFQLVTTHLETSLPSGEFEIIAAGGAARVIQDELKAFFETAGLAERLTFATSLQEKLIQALKDDPNISQSPDLKSQLESGSFLTLRLIDSFVGIQTLILKAAKRDAEATAESRSQTSNLSNGHYTVPTDEAVQRLQGLL